MTYLELCQQTLVKADVGSPRTLRSLSDADEYQAQVTSHVREAWKFIQTIHERWGWRQKDFEAELRAGIDTYRWNELNEHGSTITQPRPSIPRDTGFRDWFFRSEGHPDGPDWYIATPGQSGVVCLLPIDYEEMRHYRLFQRVNNRPTWFSSGPDLTLYLHATPDDAYVLHGRYVSGVQSLTAENHVPAGIPDEYHDLITWRAVMMVHASDEANASYQFALAQYTEMLTSLERLMLPDITVGGALA